jgi:signal transduction histidine kinase
VIATEPHRRALSELLERAGSPIMEPQFAGRLVLLDATATLAQFMVDGTPDREHFKAVVGSAVAAAAASAGRVRAFGEMVAQLSVAGNSAAAVRLEELWNELLEEQRSVTFVCAYPMAHLAGESMADLLSRICSVHARVIPAESFTALQSDDARGRVIAVLQQKARTLAAEIAERRLAEERLRQVLLAERAAREAAEAALRVRDEFLSIAAHELKTPITSLSGQAQLLQRRLAREGQLEPQRTAQALSMVTGQAVKLARLVSQLLDVTRLHAGKLTLERQPTDLSALAQQVVAAVRPLSERHTIRVSCPAAAQAEVDPFRLEQVLTNLIDNAVKYSPDGGAIEVSLSPAPPHAFELAVRDHGLGIPPEARGQIFERFYQAHGQRSPQRPRAGAVHQPPDRRSARRRDPRRISR